MTVRKGYASTSSGFAARAGPFARDRDSLSSIKSGEARHARQRGGRDGGDERRESSVRPHSHVLTRPGDLPGRRSQTGTRYLTQQAIPLGALGELKVTTLPRAIKRESGASGYADASIAADPSSHSAAQPGHPPPLCMLTSGERAERQSLLWAQLGAQVWSLAASATCVSRSSESRRIKSRAQSNGSSIMQSGRRWS